MKQNIGIYCWRNVHNDKCYIGQSVQLKNRKKQFLSFGYGYNCCVKVGEKGFNYNKINCARLKYNKESDWIYEILEYCTEEELDERESYWISFYNTVEEGYNLESGGNFGKHHSEESRKKMSIANSNPSEETRKKMSESHKGQIPWNKGKHHSEESRKKMSESHKGEIPWNRKKVLQYSLDGNFIKEWDSATTVSKELGIENISAVCTFNRKESGGYIWRFYDGGEIPLKIQPYKRKTTSKPILQYDLEGNFIKEWDSAITAEKELGVSSKHIPSVCKGKRNQTGGYKWKYKDESN